MQLLESVVCWNGPLLVNTYLSLQALTHVNDTFWRIDFYYWFTEWIQNPLRSGARLTHAVKSITKLTWDFTCAFPSCRRIWLWSPRSAETVRLGPCTRKSLRGSPTAWAWSPARTITTTTSLRTRRTTPAWHTHMARGRRSTWTRNTRWWV